MTTSRLLLLGALILAFAVPAAPVRAEEEPAPNAEAKPAPKAPKKKAAAKKKTYDYERSKYKSRSPEEGAATYRFNENGDPVDAKAKKKSFAKKKKRSEPPEVGTEEGAAACGAEESCSEKKTEADAL